MRVKNKFVQKIVTAAKKSGGRVLIVGGTVRDMLLGRAVTDYDLEIYGLSRQSVENLLKQTFPGKVKGVGKSFPVFNIRLGKTKIDISLPRTETKIAPGHRGFKITVSPELELKKSLQRRDFTINSMALDPTSGEVFDFFGGKKDLKNKALRVTNASTFGEDPLRVLRAMQFAARFELSIDPKSLSIIKRNVHKLSELSRERIWEEWKKMLLLAEKPSVGLEQGMQFGIFKKVYTQFWPLTHTKQTKIWHPEGNVWIHTKMSTDAAVKIANREKLDWESRLVLVLSALCHDLGKATTTIKVKVRIHSYGHAKAGTAPAESFLHEIGTPKHITAKVLTLVQNHMHPLNLHQNYLASGKIKKYVFYKLAAELAKRDLNIHFLLLLSEADFRGKGGNARKRFTTGEWLASQAKSLGVYKSPPKDIIAGHELVNLGFKPGPNIGRVISLANKLHQQKNLTRKEVMQLVSKLNNQGSEKDVILKLEKIFKSARRGKETKL